jgi:hypothetical protein
MNNKSLLLKVLKYFYTQMREINSHKHESSGKNKFHKRNRETNENQEINKHTQLSKPSDYKDEYRRRQRTNNIGINQEKLNKNCKNQQISSSNSLKCKWL